MSASACASPASLFGPGHPVPVPEPGRLQRVHREHQVAGRGQRRDPRAAVGLDPYHHLGGFLVLAEETSDQPVQLGHPGRSLGQPPSRQHLPGLVHHLDVVMVLSPVVTHEQPHQLSRSQRRIRSAASGRTSAT
jgi:hypothetical protein